MIVQTPRQAFQTIEWHDEAVRLIDQTRLPQEEHYLVITDVDDLVEAIKRLSVRGAPAIGVAGAYGIVLAARQFDPLTQPREFAAAVERIRDARPTAVNLAKRVDQTMAAIKASPLPAAEAALETAHRIRQDELDASIEMGSLGAHLVLDLCGGGPVTAMTICNTGGLAAVERGTALAVIQTLHEQGDLAEALPLETRPLLQGGRLTTWELEKMGASYRLIVDSAGPFLLQRGAADVVLIGADRIAANGDTANKIGSYSLALGAKAAGIPFIVVAPESTLDFETPTGAAIEIEDRGPLEVTSVRDNPIATAGSGAINPAFDVTPASLITAIVTECRVVRLDEGESLSALGALDDSETR